MEETSYTGAEAVKPDPHCSSEGHSGWVDAGTANESTESRKVIQSCRLPSVIRPERRTSVVVRLTDELLCGVYKWVSRFETPCTRTQLTGER